jgi:hypothetical protein
LSYTLETVGIPILQEWISVLPICRMIMDYIWWKLGTKFDEDGARAEELIDEMNILKNGRYILTVQCRLLQCEEYHSMRLLLSDILVSETCHNKSDLTDSVILKATQGQTVKVLIDTCTPCELISYRSSLSQLQS